MKAEQTTDKLAIDRKMWNDIVVTSYSDDIVWIVYNKDQYWIPSSLREIRGIFNGNESVIATKFIYRRPVVPGCNFCDAQLANHNAHFPMHDASRSCESGKEEHCTCDICF